MSGGATTGEHVLDGKSSPEGDVAKGRKKSVVGPVGRRKKNKGKAWNNRKRDEGKGNSKDMDKDKKAGSKGKKGKGRDNLKKGNKNKKGGKKKRKKKKKPRCSVKRRKKALKRKCTDMLAPDAILNSYYTCHGVPDMLKFRKFKWSKKKGK